MEVPGAAEQVAHGRTARSATTVHGDVRCQVSRRAGSGPAVDWIHRLEQKRRESREVRWKIRGNGRRCVVILGDPLVLT